MRREGSLTMQDPLVSERPDSLAAEGSGAIREAVGIFDTPKKLFEAADALERAGFDHAAISLMGRAKDVESKLGDHYKRAEGPGDGNSRIAYIPPESVGDGQGFLASVLIYVGAVAATGAIVASGGSAIATILAAAAGGGAGGLVGTGLARLLGHNYTHYLQEQLNQGGLVLWVRTPTPEDERRAVEVLQHHSGQAVHVHTLPGEDRRPAV
jgi:hypothetical protein